MTLTMLPRMDVTIRFGAGSMVLIHKDDPEPNYSQILANGLL